MRHELFTSVATSAMNVFRVLQEVLDDEDVHKLQQQHAAVGSSATPDLLGCADSPEAATVVLMLVGAVGIYYGSALFLRLLRKRQASALLS